MSTVNDDIRQRAKRVRLAAFDVDGTLTDGRLWFDGDGKESKAYHIHDGLGLKLLQRSTHAMKLTEDGDRCYTRAKELLGNWDAFEADLRGTQEVPEGTLNHFTAASGV